MEALNSWWAPLVFNLVWEIVGPIIIFGVGAAVTFLYKFFKIQQTADQAANLGRSMDVIAKALAAKIFAQRNPVGSVLGSVIKDVATGSLGADILPDEIPQAAIDYVKTTAASELKKFGIDDKGIAFRMAPRVAAQIGLLEASAATPLVVEKQAAIR